MTKMGIAALSVFVSFAALACAQTQTGEWTIGPSDGPGKLHFSLQASRGEHHEFNTSSDWNASDLQGLDLTTRGKHDVHFTIKRDAGDIEGEGFVRDGQGAGLFTFHGNAQYSHEMEALGFAGVTEERQISFAIHDVSVAFAREMKATGIEGLTTDKLLACRIFHVDPAFVNEMRAADIPVTSADKLIAFRIHGVSPDFVKQLAHLGYAHATPDQLIALRIHRVTPEYIENLRARGMQNLTLDQLVRLRIFGIN